MSGYGQRGNDKRHSDSKTWRHYIQATSQATRASQSGPSDGTPSSSWMRGWVRDYIGPVGYQQLFPAAECRLNATAKAGPGHDGCYLGRSEAGRERKRARHGAEAIAARHPYSRALDIFNEQEECQALARRRSTRNVSRNGVVRSQQDFSEDA